ncbi:MAG: YdcF family protein [Propionibacteriaceae bacterium]|jgi:vancomycin permeability regulator SanA|nr:YdcF family protein [Propionibacteriaceae bacterium]
MPKRPKRLFRNLFVIALVAAVVPAGLVFGLSVGRYHDLDTVPDKDVAIVFGAGLYENGTPMPYLSARLDLAKELFNNGQAKMVIVSGGYSDSGIAEPIAMRDYLMRDSATSPAIPVDKIVLDYGGLDTYGSCYRARHVFGVKEAILVTQTYHLPRAIATCQLTGVIAVGVGDESVASINQPMWVFNYLREWAASYKAVYDIAVNRQPAMDGDKDAVTRALEER